MNAAATFEQMMLCLLRDLKRPSVSPRRRCFLLYVSILIHMLRQILQCFCTAGLQFDYTKCSFESSEIQVLRHVVNAEKRRRDPDKLHAVSYLPKPANSKNVRRFLGLCTYFRKLIAGFSNIAEPLSQPP